MRIVGIRRAAPDDRETPRGSLLVDVAYALNSRPDALVEFRAWPESGAPDLLLRVPGEQWHALAQQGHGVQTFPVSYDGYQTVETHYLQARLAIPYAITPQGEVVLPEPVSDTRPVTHTWHSKLVSGWDCNDMLVPVQGLNRRRWTLDFASPAACFAALAPCDEQKRTH